MYNRVQKVNALLDAQGASVVQKFARIKTTGRDIYGYRPQAVFDAVNQVFGVDAWTQDIVENLSTDTQVIVRVTVTIGKRVATQYGEHRVMGADRGSAFKSAVTDGIQKALSLFGVGARAYRGELKDVFNGKLSETVLDDNEIDLKEAAQKVIDRVTGVAWWKENLENINRLPEEARKEIVKILGDKI
jgi:hypothetical protein